EDVGAVQAAGVDVVVALVAQLPAEFVGVVVLDPGDAGDRRELLKNIRNRTPSRTEVGHPALTGARRYGGGLGLHTHLLERRKGCRAGEGSVQAELAGRVVIGCDGWPSQPVLRVARAQMEKHRR